MSRERNPTRDRILKSAIALLEAGEASAVRMSDIAKASKISRQAVYLHFPNRAELLIAAARYLDEINDVEAKLIASRSAPTGRGRLAEWITAWGNYIPTVYGMSKALLAMKETDAEARAAWDDRMGAVRDGCRAVARDLSRDGELAAHLTVDDATDLLFIMVSVRSWEQCCVEFGWTQDRYIAVLQEACLRALVQ